MPQVGSQKTPPVKYALLFCLCLLPTACQPSSVPKSTLPTVATITPASTISPVRKVWPVQFKARFDKGFRTTCSNCRVEYVKLELRGPGHVSTPIYAIGADQNGFVKALNDTVTLSAQVPEGPNWTAIAGLYANNDPEGQPILRIGAAFHVPPTEEQIEMDLRALQTAEIIQALHEIGSEKVLTPLELQQFQAFTDALLGVEQQPDGTYQMNRLPAMSDPSNFLDARKIANLIEQGTIAEVNAASGSNLNPESLTALPERFHHFRAIPMTAGLTHLVMNPDTHQLFTFDILQNTKRIYGLTSALSPTPLTPLFNPITLGQVQNLYLSLGLANPTGQNPIPVIYVMEYTGLNRMVLKVLNQDNGQEVWSYDFAQTPSLQTRFVPVSLKDLRNPADPSDDTEVVFTTLTTGSSSGGVYALRDGQFLWRYPDAREFTGSGALSPDGQQLYLITRSDNRTSARLLALKTQSSQAPMGEAAWTQEVDLGEEVFDTTTPVVGSDGTIYVNTIDTANQRPFIPLPGHLQAIAPNGTLKWRLYLPVASFFPPIVDHHNGEDIIYTSTEGAKLHAIRQDGSEKWVVSLPGTVGEGPSGSPTIGEDLAGERVIYVPWGNGLIYAVRDQGDHGEILWAKAPGGKNNRSLLLKDGVLYATTLDGGEGQFVQVRSLKVHTPNMPASAPWPRLGGNLQASGHSPLQD